jgi:hypothetical protein
LQFTLTPTPAAANRFRFLYMMLPPRQPGTTEPYRITGTLGAPRVS